MWRRCAPASAGGRRQLRSLLLLQQARRGPYAFRHAAPLWAAAASTTATAAPAVPALRSLDRRRTFFSSSSRAAAAAASGPEVREGGSLHRIDPGWGTVFVVLIFIAVRPSIPYSYPY